MIMQANDGFVPTYIHIPHSRIIYMKMGTQFRRLLIDEQPSTMAERRARLIESQRAAGLVRRMNPKPKHVVTVIIGPTEIQCDLELLQRNTGFFVHGQHGMAYGLPTCDVSLEAFIVIYKWMARTSEVVPPALLMSVYKAAVYLKIQLLIDQFMVEFRDPQTAREEIGFHMFYGLCKLNVCAPFGKTMRVHKYFLTLIGTTEFLELWPNALASLLDSPSICVNSEVEVFIAAIIWLHHDYPARCAHAEQLLSCVRFDSIPLEALLQLRQHSSVNCMARLLFRPEIERFLKRAPSLNNNLRYCSHRIWIYDPICEYHHDAHCPKRNFITLGQFQEFQKALRHAPNLHWYHRQQLNPYVHNCRRKCRRIPGSNGGK